MISIIIPVYNGEDVIEECLKSVLVSSDNCNYEIIVVDDKSVDRSVDIVKRYLCHNVKLLENNQSAGFVKTIMRGVNNSKGDIIVSLNMDTVVESGWLEGLIRPLKIDDKVGVVGSKILYMNDNIIQHAGGFLNENALSYHVGKGDLDIGQHDSEEEVDYVCGASLACRKELLKKLGWLDTGYSPLYYEEVDMAHRFHRAGYKIIYAPSSRLRHYEGYSIRDSRKKIFYFTSRNRLRYIFKSYSARRIMFRFLFHEIKYFINIKNRDKIYLFMAYVYTICRLPEILFARMKDRISENRLKAAA